MNTYYLEKMRVFEETFGIDRLIIQVNQIRDKLNVSPFLPNLDLQSKEYDPENGIFILTDEDLYNIMHSLDEFQTRHATITESIQETYRIGNKLMDFIEKQIIIDYHLMGKQEKLEKEYPNLVHKAKKLLGHEMFFDLSSHPYGMPLDSTN